MHMESRVCHQRSLYTNALFNAWPRQSGSRDSSWEDILSRAIESSDSHALGLLERWEAWEIACLKTDSVSNCVRHNFIFAGKASSCKPSLVKNLPCPPASDFIMLGVKRSLLGEGSHYTSIYVLCMQRGLGALHVAVVFGRHLTLFALLNSGAVDVNQASTNVS